MQGQLLRTNGVDLYTETFGDPSDPPVLLIMGAMASGVWWPEGFCRMLAARGRRVLRYDHRDTGRSTSYPQGPPPYSLEDLADDALGILGTSGITRVHVVGMSLGGLLAQIMALKSPATVLTLTLIASERLVSTDPSMPPIAPDVLAYHARAGELDWSNRTAVLDYQVGAWRLLAGSAHPFDPDAIRALAAEDNDRTPNPLTPMNHALLAGGERWYDRLAEIRQPALVIHGTEDPVLPYVHGRALAADLPRATLLTLEGTGHELHRDDWERIVTAIITHTASYTHLRPEEPADQKAIHAVHAASFPTADEARLVDALRAAGRLCVSLVAVEQGEVVGHVAFSPVSVLGAIDGVGLAPVAVLPAFRRRGIAEQLIREGLAACKQLGHGFVVVLGDPRYYHRFGFMPASRWGLHDEYGGGEAFQALELKQGGIPAGGGVVRYAPEFALTVSE